MGGRHESDIEYNVAHQKSDMRNIINKKKREGYNRLPAEQFHIQRKSKTYKKRKRILKSVADSNIENLPACPSGGTFGTGHDGQV